MQTLMRNRPYVCACVRSLTSLVLNTTFLIANNADPDAKPPLYVCACVRSKTCLLLNTSFLIVSNTDPDKMRPFLITHLGLYCLSMS